MTAWAAIDCDIDSHAKLAELPSDTARYGWIRTLLEAKRQRRPGRFASAAHFRHVLGRHGRFMEDYLKANLLEKDGEELVVHDWKRHQWASSKALQRETSRGHSEDKSETSGGHELDASRAVLVPVSVGTSFDVREGVQGEPFGVGEQEARVFAFIARFGAAIRPDSGYGLRLLGLMERRGVEEVLRQAGVMAKAGEKLSDRQWTFGLEAALEAVPTGKDARAADLEEEREKRNARVQAEMAERRAERERWMKPEVPA